MLWIALSFVSTFLASSTDSHWFTEIVFQAPDKLGACAAGELDPNAAGVEIVTACRTGEIFVVRRTSRGWEAEKVFECAGEMIQVAVGDAIPEREGQEIIVCGMAEGPEVDEGPGAASCISRTGEGWRGEPLLEEPGLLHAVCVADGAVFASGFSQRVHRIVHEDGVWKKEVVAELPGAAKNAVAMKEGIAFACNDGSLVRLRREGPEWKTTVWDERDVGRARMGTDGERIVIGDDDGTLSLVSDDGRTELYRSDQKLRGAALANLMPEHDGLEVATAGYDGRIVVLRKAGEEWQATPIFGDLDKFHHLVAAELDDRSSPEIIACGYTGRLVVISRR